MESKKINQLATELAPELSDLTIIGDPTTGISKKITLSQMASLFTGTVEEYANLASFPLVGTADTIYIALDTNIIYRWNTGTSAYVELSPNIVTSLVFNDANGFDGTISLVGSTATLTITTALTQGSVGFIGASGALTQDNSNFYWDNTNKRLGINTNAPTTAIDAFGSGIIGRLNGTSTNNAFLGFASAGSNKWSIGNVQSDHRFRIYSEANAAELVSVLQTGEVGIGIANPLTKLHIFGGASALIANLDANTSVAKSISFRSGNSSRINLEVSGTESGSNAGMNFFLRTYTDAGSLLETPFQITRSTGLTTVKNIAITGLTTSFIPKANGSSALIDSLFFDDGTYAGIKASNPILYTINSSQKNWNTGDNIGYFDQRIEDTSSAGARTVSFIRSVVSAGVTNGVTTAADLVFGTSGYDATATEKMRLTNDGKFGIGTSAPNEILEISAPAIAGTSQQARIRITQNGSISSRVNLVAGVILGNDPYFAIETRQSSSPFNIVERFRIDGNGNVGIGTSSPSNILHAYATLPRVIADTSTRFAVFNLYYQGAEKAAFVLDNQNKLITLEANGDNTYDMRFNVGGFQRLFISSTGQIYNSNPIANDFAFRVNGSTTTSQSFGLQVWAGTNSSDTSFRVLNAATTSEYFKIRGDGLIQTGTSSASPYNNTSGAAANMVVTSGGTLERSTSSLKYKTDIVNYDKGLAEVLKMRPVYYKSINEREKDLRFAGLIAEEIEELGLTEFVQYAEDGTPDALAYSNMVSLLTKAIQEQQSQIEELKALINK